jgi:hypothetical protein
MQDNISPQFHGPRWAGIIVLVMASFILLMAVASVVSSLAFVKDSNQWWQHDFGGSVLVLLSYITISLFTLRTRYPLRTLVLRRAIWPALCIGAILGATLLVPAMNEHYRAFGLYLMALAIPVVIGSWLMGQSPFGSAQGEYGILLIGTIFSILCLLTYLAIAWGVARSTRRLLPGFLCSLLAGFLSPLTLVLVYLFVNYIPWMVTSSQPALPERLESYYLILLNNFFMIYSQITLALVGGLLGAIIGRLTARSLSAQTA